MVMMIVTQHQLTVRAYDGFIEIVYIYAFNADYSNWLNGALKLRV